MATYFGNQYTNIGTETDPVWQLTGSGAVPTNLGATHDAEDVDITSSSGTSATLNAAVASAGATPGTAGVMTDGDKEKLDGIAEGATANTGTVTFVGSGTGLVGGPVTGVGILGLQNTAVTAGSYTNTNLTVDAQGRITAASNGSTTVSKYNSGWQTSFGGTAVANAASITVTHNLGTTDVAWSMFANASASDTGASSIHGHDVFTSGRFGALVKNLTSNTITFELAVNGYIKANGSGAGSSESFAGDYVKVVVVG